MDSNYCNPKHISLKDRIGELDLADVMNCLSALEQFVSECEGISSSNSERLPFENLNQMLEYLLGISINPFLDSLIKGGGGGGVKGDIKNSGRKNVNDDDELVEDDDSDLQLESPVSLMARIFPQETFRKRTRMGFERMLMMHLTECPDVSKEDRAKYKDLLNKAKEKYGAVCKVPFWSLCHPQFRKWRDNYSKKLSPISQWFHEWFDVTPEAKMEANLRENDALFSTENSSYYNPLKSWARISFDEIRLVFKNYKMFIQHLANTVSKDDIDGTTTLTADVAASGSGSSNRNSTAVWMTMKPKELLDKLIVETMSDDSIESYVNSLFGASVARGIIFKNLPVNSSHYTNEDYLYSEEGMFGIFLNKKALPPQFVAMLHEPDRSILNGLPSCIEECGENPFLPEGHPVSMTRHSRKNLNGATILDPPVVNVGMLSVKGISAPYNSKNEPADDGDDAVNGRDMNAQSPRSSRGRGSGTGRGRGRGSRGGRGRGRNSESAAGEEIRSNGNGDVFSLSSPLQSISSPLPSPSTPPASNRRKRKQSTSAVNEGVGESVDNEITSEHADEGSSRREGKSKKKKTCKDITI